MIVMLFRLVLLSTFFCTTLVASNTEDEKFSLAVGHVVHANSGNDASCTFISESAYVTAAHVVSPSTGLPFIETEWLVGKDGTEFLVGTVELGKLHIRFTEISDIMLVNKVIIPKRFLELENIAVFLQHKIDERLQYVNGCREDFPSDEEYGAFHKLRVELDLIDAANIDRVKDAGVPYDFALLMFKKTLSTEQDLSNLDRSSHSFRFSPMESLAELNISPMSYRFPPGSSLDQSDDFHSKLKGFATSEYFNCERAHSTLAQEEDYSDCYKFQEYEKIAHARLIGFGTENSVPSSRNVELFQNSQSFSFLARLTDDPTQQIVRPGDSGGPVLVFLEDNPVFLGIICVKTMFYGKKDDNVHEHFPVVTGTLLSKLSSDGKVTINPMFEAMLLISS